MSSCDLKVRKARVPWVYDLVHVIEEHTLVPLFIHSWWWVCANSSKKSICLTSFLMCMSDTILFIPHQRNAASARRGFTTAPSSAGYFRSFTEMRKLRSTTAWSSKSNCCWMEKGWVRHTGGVFRTRKLTHAGCWTGKNRKREEDNEHFLSAYLCPDCLTHLR